MSNKKWESALIPFEFEGNGNIAINRPIHSLITASLLLGRLCAEFNHLCIGTFGDTADKITWETAIRHKKSGCIIRFYDYKGEASFGNIDKSGNYQDESFLKDLDALLSHLTHELFPHPYDGLTIE